MKNRNKSDLGHLTEQLNQATEQLVRVVHRLDEFEADRQHVSTVNPESFRKTADEDDDETPQQKVFNPEAGP